MNAQGADHGPRPTPAAGGASAVPGTVVVLCSAIETDRTRRPRPSKTGETGRAGEPGCSRNRPRRVEGSDLFGDRHAAGESLDVVTREAAMPAQRNDMSELAL